MKLLDGVTADTTSGGVEVYDSLTFQVQSSNFGGGTCTLQMSVRGNVGANYVDIAESALTTSGNKHIQIEGPTWVRAVLSGSTGPAALTAEVYPVVGTAVAAS